MSGHAVHPTIGRRADVTVLCEDSVVLTQAYALKDHARQLAAREGRPYQYFGGRTRKEDLARQLAERDGIQDGLVAVFATVEPWRRFSLRWREGSAFIQSARRKCLILYYYFMDRDLGLIHVRVQTWFPLQMPPTDFTCGLIHSRYCACRFWAICAWIR